MFVPRVKHMHRNFPSGILTDMGLFDFFKSKQNKAKPDTGDAALNTAALSSDTSTLKHRTDEDSGTDSDSSSDSGSDGGGGD